MDGLSPERLLELWEAGAQRHPIDRALLLFALAEPALPPDELADEPLGRRNAALMALRRARFGNPFDTWIDCPACGERMTLTIDAAQLPPAPPASPPPIELDGLRFRRPTSRDLARLAGIGDADEAAYCLLAACTDTPQALPQDAAGLEALLDRVDAALEQDDPWADPSLAVDCPACGHAFAAGLDVAAILWDEIDGVARRLLDEVHLLARAYGWHEQEILRLSARRRAAYLQRLEA